MDGSEGEKAIDISKLRDLSGYVTLDFGLQEHRCHHAARSPSSMAREGILHYRGYPIEQLAEKASFIEVSYLLLYR